MKKFITILIATIVAMVALSSCSKMGTPTEYADVTFGYRMVESNSMVATKALTSSSIIGVIDSTLPLNFEVTLTSTETNEVYTTSIGETLTLPIGTYTIDYAYRPNTPTSSVPSFTIKDDNIVITKDTDKYVLNATYECLAIAYDTEDVYYITTTLTNTIDDVRQNGISLTFIPYRYGDNTIETFSVSLIPKDKTKYKETTIEFGANGVNYEYGKYYALRPIEVETTNSSPNINFPYWKEGDI